LADAPYVVYKEIRDLPLLLLLILPLLPGLGNLLQ